MSEKNVQTITEIVEALAAQLDSPVDAATVKRLARQLAVDLKVTPSKQPGAKLTPAKVRNIRAKYATGTFTQKDLAQQYGISAPAMNLLLNGKTWAHV